MTTLEFAGQPEGRATTGADAAFALCASTLLASIVLQKVALPGTAGVFPLNLVIFPMMAALAFALGALEIDRRALVWLAAFLAVAALSTALSPSPHVSLFSLAFLLVVQLPLVFRLVGQKSYADLLNFVSTLGCFFAAVGALQFAAQFVVGSHIAFFLDTGLPEALLMKGYNSMIPLYWTSSVLKSNGVFFLEPSLFCQFTAIALVAELLCGARVLRLILLAAGLLASYSGTGLTMLALFLPFYLGRHGQLHLIVVALLIAVTVYVFSDALVLDAFTRRIGEFSDDQSSGWARFASMFIVLRDTIFTNDFTFALGRGAGTVQENFQRLPYYAFDPTWGKIIYEYGLVGAAAYVMYFRHTFCSGPAGLRFAVGYTYLVLGGYLLDPAVLMQAAALVVWPGHADRNERFAIRPEVSPSMTVSS